MFADDAKNEEKEDLMLHKLVKATELSTNEGVKMKWQIIIVATR